jgi:hypothetical protein
MCAFERSEKGMEFNMNEKGFVPKVDTKTLSNKSGKTSGKKSKTYSGPAVELGLLTKSERDRIKEICKDDFSPAGKSRKYTDKNGEEKVLYAYNSNFLENALLQVLKNRLMAIHGYSYDNWIKGDIKDHVFSGEIKRIISRNYDESRFVKDFIDGARKLYFEGKIVRMIDYPQFEEDIDRCLASINVPVLIRNNEQELERD